MQDKMTGSQNSQDMPDHVLEYLLEQLMARGGERLYQGFEERLSRKEQEKQRAILAEQQKKQEEIHKGWLEQHYGNLQQAFEADPEYKELIQQRKLNEDNFGTIYDSLLPYKDKAPAMLKHLLRNENLLGELEKSPNELDARYLLNNVFSDVNREAANPQNQAQAQTQSQAPDNKPIKLPNPQLMPELPSSTNIDDEVQRLISRM
jgi:hypothetical protein